MLKTNGVTFHQLPKGDLVTDPGKPPADEWPTGYTPTEGNLYRFRPETPTETTERKRGNCCRGL